MRMILNALFLLLSLQSVVGADVAYHPSRVIVGTNFYETGNLDISSLETTYGVKVARYIGSDMLVMNIEDQVKVDDKIKALKDSSLFRFVEPDYKTTPMYQDGTGSPNLYGMDKISMPCVWSKITNGTANTRVCVIDTGVDYKHTDLVANIWVNPWENKIGMGVDNDKNGYVDDVYGINAITNKGNATDDHYHGTHVSGTIGAVRNDKGVIGVAPKVDIIPCKFLSSSGSGYYSDAIQCIEYCKAIFDKYRSMDATKHQYTGIYSNSWGGSGFSQALYDSIKKLETGSTQSLFIAAAGNSASNSDVTPMYPAAYDLNNIVSVAATDSNDNLASFSNYGVKTVDLAAPGVSIVSTGLSNTYVSLSGTSMATPHVAGVASLMAFRKRDATSAELKNALIKGVDVLPKLQTKVLSGGRLNALNSFNVLLNKKFKC